MSNLHPLLQEHMQRAGVDGQMLNPAVTALLKQVSATYTRVERCLADEVGVASRLLPILRTDVAGTLIEWNAQIAELTGVPPSDVLGRSLMEHVEKAARPRVLRVLAKALQGQVVHCVQVPFLCPSGDVQMLSLGANAHYDVKGRLVGVLAVAQLLPQQHHASVPSSPATSEASAGGGPAAGPSPIDCMNVACVATDAHGKVVTWNQTMESLSGYSRAEVRSGRGSDTRRARRTLARARSLPPAPLIRRRSSLHRCAAAPSRSSRRSARPATARCEGRRRPSWSTARSAARRASRSTSPSTRAAGSSSCSR